jgi:hypothetical protein
MALAGARLLYVFEPPPMTCTRIEVLSALNPELPIRMVRAAMGERTGRSSSVEPVSRDRTTPSGLRHLFASANGSRSSESS